MGRERRQAQRREQQRRRRQGSRPGYEPVGQVRFTGIMGLFQRHARIVFVGGIMIMIVSLGAIFFPTSPHAAAPPDDATSEPTPTATIEVTATPEGTPTEAPEEIQRVYGAEPAIEIDSAARYEAVIQTERGAVRIELLAAESPNYVNNFVFLARNHFYDGLTFHRVVPGFIVQAGDPMATGFGGPGYPLTEESNDLVFDSGVISMAKEGPEVNGSQFFVTLDPQPALADNFTVFGRVIEGLDILRGFAARNPSEAGASPGVRILSIEILERNN